MRRGVNRFPAHTDTDAVALAGPKASEWIGPLIPPLTRRGRRLDWRHLRG